MAPKTTFQAWAEYLPTCLVIHVVSRLSWGLVGKLGSCTGLLVYYLSARYRNVAYQNINIAFGAACTGRESRKIVRGAFKSFGRTVFELVRSVYMSRAEIIDLTECSDSFHALLSDTRGVLICGAHQGNFFWPVIYGAALGYEVYVVVEPLENYLLHKKYLSLLARLQIKVIPKDQAAKVSARVLAKGGKVMMAVDQEAQQGGVFIPFFGEIASTQRGASVIARWSDSCVAFVSHRRVNGLNVIEASQPFYLPNRGQLSGRQGDVENMQVLNGLIERSVHQKPDEYLWLHPRWKTRPTGEPELYKK